MADPLALLKQSRAASTGQAAPAPQAAPIATPKAAPAPVSQPTQAKAAPVNANPHGQLFSGNILQKGMDILRTMSDYPVASFLKGQENKINQLKQSNGGSLSNVYKSQGILPTIAQGVTAGFKNIIPGVKNRTQIGREAGDYNPGAYLTKNPVGQSAFDLAASLGVPSLPIGKVAGIAGRIAGPIAKVASEAPIVQKGMQLASKVGTGLIDAAKSSPKVSGALEQLPGLEHFRNPEAGKIIQGAQDTANTRVSKLFNQVNDAAHGLTSTEREQVGHYIEGNLPNASSKIATRGEYMKQLSDNIGKELVNLGVMGQDTFDKYKGQYLSHIADTIKNTTTPGGSGNPVKFFLNSLKERKNILGSEGNPDYIKEFQFPVFKALAGEIHTAESTKAMQQIATKFGTPAATDAMEKTIGSAPRTTPDGRVALEDLLPTKIGRLFKNTAVTPEIADYVKRAYASKDPNFIEKLANKAMDYWKLGKTIYSGPGYHTRNAISNVILSDFSTGEGLPATIAHYGEAVKAYLGKGTPKMQQYLQEMKDSGIINRQDIAGGIKELKPEAFGQGESTLKKVVTAPQKFQQANEETSKLNVFRYWRDKGASVEEAGKKAEEAIFSPYNISQTERGLVKNVIPFYSFTRQALPFTLKTAANHPERITKYEKAKTAVEGLSPDGASNNQGLPDNMQGQVRLPVKDSEGNYSYADPTYIYPYGNFGDMGKGLPFGLSLNPLVSEYMAQQSNNDPYFNTPIAKSNIPERAKVQRVQHGFQTFAPNIMPTDFLPGGGIPTGQGDIPLNTRGGSKLTSAFTNKPDYAGRTRSKTQAILDTLGLKSSVYRPADQQKFDTIDKGKQLDSIKKELITTLRDQSKTPEEKQAIIQRLREVQAQIVSGQ
jgi:hypothetical protein